MNTRATRLIGSGALMLLYSFQAAQANTWDMTGEIEFCNPLVCNLAGIMVGDDLGGFVQADDAASGPGSTFTEMDVLDFLIAVFDPAGMELFRVGPEEGMLVSATITVGADGEFESGSAEFFGEFDGGPAGLIPLDLIVDVTNQSFSVSTTFLGLGEIAGGSIIFAAEPDGDDVASLLDNCTTFANALQTDTDLDSIGNACDPDHDQNCIVNFIDLGAFKAEFPGTNPAFDYTGDGVVNFLDLGRMKELFFNGPTPGPGPSGLPNACSP